MALNVGYFHTWHGNFTATANQAVTPADFDHYCITAPVDARLGAASGSRICGLYDVTLDEIRPGRQPGAAGRRISANSTIGSTGWTCPSTHASDAAGVLQGGVSTGRTVTDNCAVVQPNPQIRVRGERRHRVVASDAFCHVVLSWADQTQFKLAANYPLPWWGLQVSSTIQNLPGIPVFANYVATNAEIAPSLGRNLSSCPTATGDCTATVNVAVIPPNTKFEDRFSQVDFRLAKTIRIGNMRVQGMFDLYNLFNTSAVLSESFAYGPAWLRPSGVLAGRLAKFGAQVDF